MAFPQFERLRRQALLTVTAPAHGATRTVDVSASRVRAKAVASQMQRR
ncbi:hypothetical protein [Erythrobacter sp. SAORIC-644]|nr:hypothetical protein [Erythrobacter sp. SAORIC-644]QPL39575.1 hypothetical protein IT881_16255 [Erythrobacter sp. A30-3]